MSTTANSGSAHSSAITLRDESGMRRDKAVILLHGLTGTPHEMSDVAAFLYDKGFDAFVPCLSGHDSTVEELTSVTVEQWLNDVRAIVQQVRAAGYPNCYLIGQSFGALLSLWACAEYPQQFKKVVLLSVPFRLKNVPKELLLRALASLPDEVLNRLPRVKKTIRAEGVFARQRSSYPEHAVGAVARMFKIRSLVQARLASLKIPVLLLHDPLDHHLSSATPRLARSLMQHATVTTHWFPGGQHELTQGRLFAEVKQEIQQFLEEA